MYYIPGSQVLGVDSSGKDVSSLQGWRQQVMSVEQPRGTRAGVSNIEESTVFTPKT